MVSLHVWVASQHVTAFTTYSFCSILCYPLYPIKNLQTSLFKFLLVKPGFESSVVLLLLGTLDVGETRDVGKPIDSKGCLCSSRSSSMM